MPPNQASLAYSPSYIALFPALMSSRLTLSAAFCLIKFNFSSSTELQLFIFNSSFTIVTILISSFINSLHLHLISLRIVILPEENDISHPPFSQFAAPCPPLAHTASPPATHPLQTHMPRREEACPATPAAAAPIGREMLILG